MIRCILLTCLLSMPVAAAAQETRNFRDEFTGTQLDPAYRVLNPDRKRMALTGDGLVLVTHAEMKNVIEFPGPFPDAFVTTIRVLTPPDADGQMIALRIGDDADNVRIGLYVDCCPADALVAFSLTTVDSENSQRIERDEYELFRKPVYLRIERRGPLYRTAYSGDGSRWTELGEHLLTAAPAAIYMVASNFGNAPEKPVAIDSFEVRELLD